MTTTNINVERLSTGTLIWVRDDYNAAAEVLDIDFDNGQYIITYGSDHCRSTTCVNAGEAVEAFDHQTFLRSLDDVSFEEWEALNTVALARLDASLADAPVNLLSAVTQFRQEASAYQISQATVTDFLCALVAASFSSEVVREGSDYQMEVAAE